MSLHDDWSFVNLLLSIYFVAAAEAPALFDFPAKMFVLKMFKRMWDSSFQITNGYCDYSLEVKSGELWHTKMKVSCKLRFVFKL